MMEYNVQQNLWKNNVLEYYSRQTLLRNLFFKYNNEASVEIEYDVEGCGVKYSLTDDKLCENIYFYDTEHGMLNSDTIKEVIK